MEVRVGGTERGQKWRVTGFQVGDVSPSDGHTAMVVLEFWVEYDGEHGRQYGREVKTFDPELARELGRSLIAMADHAEM